MNKRRRSNRILAALIAATWVAISIGGFVAWYTDWAPLRPVFLPLRVLMARRQEGSPAKPVAPAKTVQRRGQKPVADDRPAAVDHPLASSRPEAKSADERQTHAGPDQSTTSAVVNPAPADMPEAPPEGAPAPETSPKAATAPVLDAASKPADSLATTPASKPVSDMPSAGSNASPPPWATVWEATDEPPSALTVCFDDFDLGKFVPKADDLKQWFEQAPGQTWTVKNTRPRYTDMATFDGAMRLRMPWRDEVALRISLERLQRLRIHFLHGDDAVTLVYFDQSGRTGWAAYASRRSSATSLPEEIALLADDQGRARRASPARDGGVFELRCGDGELTLSCGDIVLLQAPFPGRADEVIFAGQAAFRGITAVRSAAFPAADRPEQDAAQTLDLARLSWTETLAAEANFERAADGSVTLRADRAATAGWVAAPLDSSNVGEVVLHVDQATPGVGVFLGPPDAPPREVLRFVSDTEGRATHVRMQADPNEQIRSQPLDKEPLALTTGAAWIRLLFGCGVLRSWISHDGVHWAQPYPARPYPVSAATSVGLHYAADRPGCRIRLRTIQIRPLPELNALADPALLARVPPLNDAPNLGVWRTRLCQAQPADADDDAWRRSGAVRALAAGCARDLGTALLELLLDDPAASGLPITRRLALLNEAALLWDTSTDGALVQRLVQRYFDLGFAAQATVGWPPYSSVRRDFMSVPLVTPHSISTVNSAAVRAEIIQLANASRWDDLYELCRQLRFFAPNEPPPYALLRWAETISAQATLRSVRAHRHDVASADWQPTCLEELSRETYNTVAELDGLLDSGSFDDAARLVGSLDAETSRGVAPHVRDRQLLVSLSAALETALESNAALRAAIAAQYAQTSVFRVRRAIQDGDLAAVRLATVQFAGLSAAAEAHRWLGDRALAIGWFDHALSEYRRAASSASATERADLAARHRLAAAMLGRDLGKPPATAVEIGGTELAPATFEALVAEQLKRNAPRDTAVSTGAAASPTIPSPSGFAPQIRAGLMDPVGREPHVEVARNVRSLRVDWAGRQLAVALIGDKMYASNRFQVSAFDLNTGDCQWQSQPPDGEPARSMDWPLIRMRPLVVANRIFVRTLYGEQPVLVCLERDTGGLIWTSAFDKQDAPASDPLWLQGRLGVLMIARLETGENLLRWDTLDPASGIVVSQTSLLRLNEVWWRRRCCEAIALEDGFVVCLSGAVLCCDAAGNVRWLRRETPLPPAEEAGWVAQEFRRPLRVGNDLYVLQPGGCTVSRLDARSGRLVWSRLLPDARRLLGIAGSRLIVQTERELLALDTQTGDSQWARRENHLLDACLSGDNGLVYARLSAMADGANRFCPELVWLDAATGEPSAQTVLRELADDQPYFGPMIASGRRLWAFFGRGEQDATRSLVELVPQGEADAPPPRIADDPWMRHIPETLRRETARLLGDWHWLAAESVGPQGIEPDGWGERESLGVRARRQAPAALGRRLALPPDSSPKLRVRVGNDPSQAWSLEVRMNDALVAARTFTAQTDPEPWKQFELDLRPAAGKSGWLTILAAPAENRDTVDVFWKQLEIAL